MKLYKLIFSHLILLAFSLTAFASNTIELDTTVIKGNKESPAILYIVPWKEMRTYTDEYQGLVIDDLQEDILSPNFPGNELLVK